MAKRKYTKRDSCIELLENIYKTIDTIMCKLEDEDEVDKSEIYRQLEYIEGWITEELSHQDD